MTISCSDSEEDILVTQTLESKVTDFFYQLDQHANDTKSTQAKKQTKARFLSDRTSVCAKTAGKLLAWAFTTPSRARIQTDGTVCPLIQNMKVNLIHDHA